MKLCCVVLVFLDHIYIVVGSHESSEVKSLSNMSIDTSIYNHLCAVGCNHMLHCVLLQPVLGPMLHLGLHCLGVQMVRCNLLCTLGATLLSRAVWGHRSQLKPLSKALPPSLLLVIESLCHCSFSVCHFWTLLSKCRQSWQNRAEAAEPEIGCWGAQICQQLLRYTLIYLPSCSQRQACQYAW